MMQPSLFEAREIVRNPICGREPHCGHKAELGPARDLGECINQSITCLSCPATGEQSTRKDLR